MRTVDVVLNNERETQHDAVRFRISLIAGFALRKGSGVVSGKRLGALRALPISDVEGGRGLTKVTYGYT